MFVKETENVLASKEVGKDLISLTRLQQKHKVSSVPDNFYLVMGSIDLGSLHILLSHSVCWFRKQLSPMFNL